MDGDPQVKEHCLPKVVPQGQLNMAWYTWDWSGSPQSTGWQLTIRSQEPWKHSSSVFRWWRARKGKKTKEFIPLPITFLRFYLWILQTLSWTLTCSVSSETHKTYNLLGFLIIRRRCQILEVKEEATTDVERGIENKMLHSLRNDCGTTLEGGNTETSVSVSLSIHFEYACVENITHKLIVVV